MIFQNPRVKWRLKSQTWACSAPWCPLLGIARAWNCAQASLSACSWFIYESGTVGARLTPRERGGNWKPFLSALFQVGFHHSVQIMSALTLVPDLKTEATCYLFKNILLKILFIARERGREGEKEGEKHQCVVVSCVPPTSDLARNPGMCPAWESNCRPSGLQVGTQSTEPHQPGQPCVI